MKKNMGLIDRAVRVVLAIIFFAIYFTGAATGWVATLLLILGIVFLATSAISFCPLYAPFGISTCKLDPDEN